MALWVRNVTRSTATPPPPAPAGNVYEQLVQNGKRVSGKLPQTADYQKADIEDLKSSIRATETVLKDTRALFSKPSQVLLIFNMDMSEMLERQGGLRNLGRLFSIEAEIASRENRPDDAANALLDQVRFATMMDNDGLLIDTLVAVALESGAERNLLKLAKSLSREQCTNAIKLLSDIDRNRDPIEKVFNTENYWFERTTPLYYQFMMKLNGSFAQLRKPAETAAKASQQRVKIECRQTIVDLAAQLYFLDNNKLPEDAKDLVPKYLPELLKMPGGEESTIQPTMQVGVQK
jgi:hypothetical protein